MRIVPFWELEAADQPKRGSGRPRKGEKRAPAAPRRTTCKRCDVQRPAPTRGFVNVYCEPCRDAIDRLETALLGGCSGQSARGGGIDCSDCGKRFVTLWIPGRLCTPCCDKVLPSRKPTIAQAEAEDNEAMTWLGYTRRAR